MVDGEILMILKNDLLISSTAQDAYLSSLIQAAREFIAKEGIVLTSSTGDGLLVEMYAAYLYRKRRGEFRRGETSEMPRMLRWALNNRLFGKEV